MAKKKKKKVQPKVTPSKQSQTYLNSCYATARRIIQMFGGEESTFDILTKRQKHDIFKLVVSPPHIAVTPGHKMPKSYIRYMQEELIMFMKKTYVSQKYEVTLMDIATVGLSIYLTFSLDKFVDTLTPVQKETVQRLRMAFATETTFISIQDRITGKIKSLLILLSQPNFRIYGQSLSTHRPTINHTIVHQTVYIVVHECQTLRFKYNNVERTAFRLALGQFVNTPYTGATIATDKISPDMEHGKLLNIYVQSHAIHRFKERIDTLYPIMRNELLILSLMFVQKIVWAPNKTPLIACVMPFDGGEKTVGYFAFTIEGNNLLVLTLLPMLSYSVPEGRILYDRLHLSPEDLKYLGMDKLSFFYEVDISQIPILKKVLYDELHLEYVHNIYNSFREKDAPFNEKKTLFVKNFFQKLEATSRQKMRPRKSPK
jgi:hypothetical protein